MDLIYCVLRGPGNLSRHRMLLGLFCIGTLGGIGGRGVRDYILPQIGPDKVLIMGIKAPTPPPPYPAKGPYDKPPVLNP